MEGLMSYPILTINDAEAVGSEVHNAMQINPNSAEAFVSTFRGLEKYILDRKGGDWNEAEFMANLKEFERNRREDRPLSRIRMEEDFAEHFADQVELISDAALQDPDFWRYLSVFPYRRYIYELEKDFTSRRYGGEGNRNLVRWTLIRGYLWGARTMDPAKKGEERFEATRAYRVAREDAGFGALSENTVPDFYISQVIRRRWWFHKEAYLAMIDATCEAPLLNNNEESRQAQMLGSYVGRLSSNLYFPAMNRVEIKEVILAEKAKVPLVSGETELS
jgi:hypothetical protein